MVRSTTRTSKRKSGDRAYTKTTTSTRYSRNDLKMKKLEAELGADPQTVRERMKQSGRTKRAAAYSGAVTVTGSNMAQNMNAYDSMAAGGIGYTEPAGSSDSDKKSSDIVISR